MAVASLLVLAMALLAGVAAAADDTGPGRKFRRGGVVEVAEAETVAHDLYVAADRLRMDGRIDGDLTVAARRATIGGVVTGDLLVLGGEVRVTGEVQGDVRVLGGEVIVSGRVGKDVLAAGRALTVEAPARVGGDLIYAALRGEVLGTVDGGILTTGGEQPAGSHAASPLYARDGGGASVPPTGATNRQASGDDAGGSGFGGRFTRHLLKLLLFGGLLLWLAGRVTAAAATAVRQRPLWTFGQGALAIVAVVAVAITVALAIFDLFTAPSNLGVRVVLDIIGFFALLGASFVVLVLLILVTLTAQAVVSIALGRLALSRTQMSAQAMTLLSLLVGAAVVALLVSLPGLGVPVQVLCAVFGLGAFIAGVRRGPEPAAVVAA